MPRLRMQRCVKRKSPKNESRPGGEAGPHTRRGNGRLEAVLAAIKQVISKEGAFGITRLSIRTWFRGNMTRLWRSDGLGYRWSSIGSQSRKESMKDPINRRFFLWFGTDRAIGFDRDGRWNAPEKSRGPEGKPGLTQGGDERCSKHRNCSLADKGRRGSLRACRS